MDGHVAARAMADSVPWTLPQAPPAAPRPMMAAMNTAAQMLTGGVVLLVFALLTGERWPAAPT